MNWMVFEGKQTHIGNDNILQLEIITLYAHKLTFTQNSLSLYDTTAYYALWHHRMDLIRVKSSSIIHYA